MYITAPEVKDMIEKDPNAVLINVLSAIEYDGLHITGSINIPITSFRNSDLLPKDLDLQSLPTAWATPDHTVLGPQGLRQRWDTPRCTASRAASLNGDLFPIPWR